MIGALGQSGRNATLTKAETIETGVGNAFLASRATVQMLRRRHAQVYKLS